MPIDPSLKTGINEAISTIRNKYRGSGIENAEQRALQEMANLAREKGVNAGQISAATGRPESNIQAIMDRFAPIPQPTPQPQQPYGLGGAESAITSGAQKGINEISRTRGQVDQLYGQGIEGLSPFMEPGQEAGQLQAALSGALGPEAQQQAFEQYQASPYVEQARENAERAILRNASATGSIGSGNTLDQLYQNAAGMFMQDFGNQFQRTGQVADRGISAATTGAGLRGQQAGIQSNLGQFQANIPIQAGRDVGQFRYQAGRDIADAVSGTTSSLADLVSRQGAGMSDIVGQTTTNINNLFQQAAQGDAGAREQLGVILSNLAAQQGSQYAGLPMIQQQPTNYLGQVGQLASGIGGMLSYYQNQPQNQQSQPVQLPSFNPYNPNVGQPINPTNYGGYA